MPALRDAADAVELSGKGSSSARQITNHISGKLRRITVSEQTVQTGLSDNAASGLAYVTFIPAIVFLVTAPYNQNRTIRFHSWQSIFLFVACIAIDIALGVLLRIPFLGFMTLLLWPLVGLTFLIIWILCVVKPLNGQRFKPPIIGELAEKQAGGGL